MLAGQLRSVGVTTPNSLTLPADADAPSWLQERATHDLARARSLVNDLKATTGLDATEVMRRWNEIERTISNLASIASVFSEMHTSEPARSRGDDTLQDVERLTTELELDTDLFAVFERLDACGLDRLAARLHAKVLQDFRRAGVDRDEATRQRLREISERLVVISQEFSKNIRQDVRSIRLSPDRLAGLPQDWVDAHPAGTDGLVQVTTDYPDVIPFATFAHDADARRELRIEFLNRGWPVNDELLQELFALRAEYARLVGYANWADYDAEVKMIGAGTAIKEFIDSIAAAATESGERDREVLLNRLRQDRPGATTIDAADLTYYTELVRKERFGVDSAQVRTYFDFTRVREGLLEVTGRLFGLVYRPVQVPVWHEDVAVYDVYLRQDAANPADERPNDGGTGSADDAGSADRQQSRPGEETPGQLLGRIYLDLHPREGKFKHAAQFDLVPGVAGVQLPEGVLACNFSRGLMEHDDVVTLFHEFGHLLHHVLAGRGEWVRFSGVATEWDFVEAPSQMLEEWAWDAEVLATFAVNAEGDPIPADLVARMRQADDFGKGFDARTQMFYAAMSYDFHVNQVEDLTARTAQLQEQYSLFPYIPGTHMAAAFGHLDGYSSGYYTYMWSLVIAKDMFSAFDRADMFAPEVAHRYRETVLVSGGSRDAADLVADFLGRPYSFDAFAAWLAQ